MDNIITFTPAQLIAAVLAICAGVSCISGAINVIANWVKKAKSPEMEQDKRLTNLEERMARHDELLTNDNIRLKTIEDGNRITQKSLLALLSHGIDGNDVEAMKEAKKQLQDHLIGSR